MSEPLNPYVTLVIAAVIGWILALWIYAIIW